jgi:membrane protein YqaA with SNARE-associated domain
MICRQVFCTLGLILSFGGQPTWAFSVAGMERKARSSVCLSAAQQENGDSRRSFFSKAGAVAVAGFGFPFLPLDVAHAVSGTNKVNGKLKG